MVDKSGGKRGGWGVSAWAGAAMGLLALVAGGCGGGGGGHGPVVAVAGVWVANSAGAGVGTARVQHYPGLDFTVNGTSAFAPSPLLTSPFVAPQDTLFDSNSNLWVVDGGKGRGTGAAVYEFLFSQLSNLNSNSSPTPHFAITSLSFKFPQFAVFDGLGNLWVSDSVAQAVFKFSAAQLASSSGVGLTPTATLISSDFNGPLGMAIDQVGNLWIVNNGGTTIVELTPSQVVSAKGLTPVAANTVLLGSAPAGGLRTINNPWGILFDRSGNMWITNEQNTPPPTGCAGSVVEFTAGTFSGPGALAPPANVTITPATIGSTSSLCDPNGISMNASGNIVVANAVGNSLALYTANQVSRSGSPTPQTFVVGSATLLNAPTGLTFGPASLQ